MDIKRLPSLLNIPEKMLPLIRDFHKYKYFLIDGGRGSSKTSTIARVILYLSDMANLRIVCGRETQNSIEESVYTVLGDLIRDHDLSFEVQASKINHNKSGSTIRFKGFREQGAVNIKGLEGVDVLWIDEAQAVTKATLEVLIPTIRKDTSKLIFTMNRNVRDDPVYSFLVGREDCLHIHIDFFENPFCPLTLKIEAEECRRNSQKEYDHIWLGKPLDKGSDYLFSGDKLDKAKVIETYGDYELRQRVMSIDFAAQGGDLCVATILDRKSFQHWSVTDQIAWDEADTMVSTGKIVSLIAEYTPNITVLDCGGMGYVVFNRLTELKQKIIPFRGEATEGVNTTHYANTKTEAYYLVENWLSNGFLHLPKEFGQLHRELEQSVRYRYKSNGQRIIVPKDEMRRPPFNQKSPDHADSLMMGVWGAIKHLGKSVTSNEENVNIRRVSNNSARRRK